MCDLPGATFSKIKRNKIRRATKDMKLLFQDTDTPYRIVHITCKFAQTLVTYLALNIIRLESMYILQTLIVSFVLHRGTSWKM